MDKTEINFDSFSPFWIQIKNDGTLIGFSSFFTSHLAKNENLFDGLSFKRMFIRDKKDLYRNFENKILDFELSSLGLGFRGNFHKINEYAIIVAWPKLRDISDIRKFNIHVEMSHPSCILTDLLITKDLLKKSQEKINKIEIQKVENKLFENQERTKNILKNMKEGIIVQCSDGTVLECNPAAMKIFELTDSQVFKFDSISKDRKLSIEDGSEQSFDWLANQFLVAPFQNKLVFFTSKNKTTKWVRLNCSEFIMDSVSYYLTTFQDVTEKVIKEKELEEQKEIAHHNAKLASIGELAAGVGHEINNPLAVISGQVTILEKILKDPTKLDQVEDRLVKINKAITRINNITKGLKTFSRADTEDIIDFDLSELVQDTVDMFREILGADEITIEENITPQLWIRGNYGRLQQVVVNLLNNARDAVSTCENKKIEVNLSLNNQVCLEVKDSGLGMTEEVKNKIFEPFFTTKEVNKGTGIGLALVSSIIKEHNGKIFVDSVEGLWTSFKIFIPVILYSSNQKTNKAKNEMEKNNVSSVEGQPIKISIGGKILILDDEEGIRDVLSELLCSEGYDVVTVSDGREGLEVFKKFQNEIFIIISDMKMPHMDGPTFLKTIRENYNYKGSFYFITGGVNIDIEAIEKLVDGVIMKPFDYTEIFQIISSSKLSA